MSVPGLKTAWAITVVRFRENMWMLSIVACILLHFVGSLEVYFAEHVCSIVEVFIVFG